MSPLLGFRIFLVWGFSIPSTTDVIQVEVIGSVGVTAKDIQRVPDDGTPTL